MMGSLNEWKWCHMDELGSEEGRQGLLNLLPTQ